jgi:hypothetical protein
MFLLATLNKRFYTLQKAYLASLKFVCDPLTFPLPNPVRRSDIYWGLETEADYRITKGTGLVGNHGMWNG